MSLAPCGLVEGVIQASRIEKPIGLSWEADCPKTFSEAPMKEQKEVQIGVFVQEWSWQGQFGAGANVSKKSRLWF